MIKKLIATAILSGTVLTGIVWAEAAKNAEATKSAAVADNKADKIKHIKSELKTMFGGEEADKVIESDFPGLYEVTVGTEVVYISEDTQFLFYGNLIDRKNKIDLTRRAKDAAEKAYAATRKATMDKQDATKTIDFKAKDEKYVLNVFTDIDCPYCLKLHNEVPALNKEGITVKYYLFPRSGINSPSYKKAVSAWCADDNKDALTKAKNRQAIPSKECENPVAAQYNLGQEIGVTGTPALVTEKGTLIPGYMPANILISRLKSEE